MLAVQQNNLECVPFLLSEQTMQSKYDSTAHCCACCYDKVEFAKYLLRGAGVVDKWGRTPLQIAQQRSKQCVQLIENYQKDKMFRVEYKFDWWVAVKAGYIDSVKKYYQQYKNERTDMGESALQLAAYYNHKDCVEFLAQFELKLVDQEGRTALMRAASRNCFECVPFLLQEINMRDKSGMCAFYYACENICEESIKLLKDESYIIQNETDWYLSAQYGNLDAIKQVVYQFKGKNNSTYHTYIKTYCQTALQAAVINNQQAIVEFLSLYECGQKANDGKTALIHSVCNSKPQFIQYLQSEIGLQDALGKTALIYACEAQCKACIEQLLEESLIQDKNGLTPQQICEKSGQKEALKVISKYAKTKMCSVVHQKQFAVKSAEEWFMAATCGYIISIQTYSKKYQKQKNNLGQTALMLSSKFNHKDCAKHLAQFETGLVDQEGRTALMQAAERNSLDCVLLLLNELKIVDQKGWCALHYACSYNFIECMKLLLEEFAVINKEGKTPLQIAQEGGNKECEQILKQYADANLQVMSEHDWFIAAKYGNLSVMKQNIDQYKNKVDLNGQNALMIVTQLKYDDCIEFLSQYEQRQQDKNGNTALIVAVQNNNFRAIKYLSKELRYQNILKQTALHIAVSNNQIECVGQLLVEATIEDGQGKTSLQIAQENKFNECVNIIEDYFKGDMQIQTDSVWFTAVKYANFNVVQKSIQQFKQKRDKSNQSALIVAAINNWQNFVEFLSKHETGIADSEGKTALIHVVSNNHPELIQYLTKEMKMQDKNGFCALHYACKNGHVECAKQLLDEYSLDDKSGKTPLQIAQENSKQEIILSIETFSKNKQQIQNESDWFIAAKYGNLGAIKQVSQQYVQKKDQNNQTALIIAVLNNQKEVVEFLSQYEAGITDNDGKTALIHSVINDHHEFIQYLPKEKKMQDNSGFCALHYACKNGNAECTKQLLDEYACVDRTGKTPLMIAQDNKQHECVSIIENFNKKGLQIQNELDWFIAAKFGNKDAIQYVQSQYVKKKDKNNQSALMIAVLNDQKSVVEFLSQYEAGISDSNKKTALIHTIVSNHPEFLQYLQKELKMQDNDGKTALIHSVILNKPHYIPLLKQEIKLQDNQGKTALYYACFYGYMDCARQLLEESYIKDANGISAQQVAVNEKHYDCVKLIGEYLMEQAARVEVLQAKIEQLFKDKSELEKQLVEKDELEKQIKELNKKIVVQQTIIMQKFQDFMGFQ